MLQHKKFKLETSDLPLFGKITKYNLDNMNYVCDLISGEQYILNSLNNVHFISNASYTDQYNQYFDSIYTLEQARFNIVYFII